MTNFHVVINMLVALICVVVEVLAILCRVTLYLCDHGLRVLCDVISITSPIMRIDLLPRAEVTEAGIANSPAVKGSSAHCDVSGLAEDIKASASVEAHEARPVRMPDATHSKIPWVEVDEELEQVGKADLDLPPPALRVVAGPSNAAFVAWLRNLNVGAAQG
jgi:hypothetical protein